MAMVWGVVLTSCGSDNDKNEPDIPDTPAESPIEDFNQGNMNFTEEAGDQTFTFTANASWSVSVAETSGGIAWCTVSPAKGEAGEQIVTVKVSANDTYDDRSVTLTLKAGTETETFVVTQKQQNALLLTSDKYEVNQKGGIITVEVKANVKYTATISEVCKDWITEAADTKALTTTTKSYQISANEDGEKREGTIVFSDGTLTETVHIYQAGGNVILLTENEYYADAAGEEITVELRSNCEYEVVMPTVDWIHEVTTRAMSSHTLHYTVDPNETYDNREAIIVYRDVNNSTADTLTVIQAQKDAIVLTEKEYTVSPEGETIEVKLASNTEYTIAVSDNWITEVENAGTKALVDNKHYFQIAKSNSSSERRGSITFSDGKGIRETITVIQEKPILEITSEEEIQITAGSQTLEVALHANVDFNVVTEADWINQTGITQSENGQTVTFSINENAENNSRSAEIVFTNEDFRLEKSLTVTQQGKMLEVTVKYAGTLSQLVDDSWELQNLKINGPINGTDIRFLRSIMDDLKSTKPHFLDLSGASIVEGGAPYYDLNHDYNTSDNEIGEIMFYGCVELESIILPDNVTKIKNHAFESCRNLKDITMPKKLVVVEGYPFENCPKLSTVRIPDLTTWFNIEFEYLSSNPFTFSNRNDGKFYVDNKLIGDLLVPDGINLIKPYAFYSCNSLITVTTSNSVTEIGREAFRYCDNLQRVVLTNSVNKISLNAFIHCN